MVCWQAHRKRQVTKQQATLRPASIAAEKSSSLPEKGRSHKHRDLSPQHNWATQLGNLGNSLTNSCLAGGPLRIVTLTQTHTHSDNTAAYTSIVDFDLKGQTVLEWPPSVESTPTHAYTPPHTHTHIQTRGEAFGLRFTLILSLHFTPFASTEESGSS